jgi:hypothetical protein
MPEIRRALRRLSCLVAAIGLLAFAAPATWAQATPAGQLPSQAQTAPAHQIYTSPQPPSNADFSGHGANTHGPYDSTRSGAPALNGNGGGAAIGKPCAACVGKADNKNPAGQMPDGSDPNAGYECDRNHGIGRTNPAHTGCVVTSTVPVIPIVHTKHPTHPTHTSSTPTPPTSAGIGGVSAHRNTPAPISAVASTGAPVSATLDAALFMILIGAAFVLLGRRAPRGAHLR